MSSVFQAGRNFKEATPSTGIYGATWHALTAGATSILTRTDDAADFPDPVPYVSGATEYSSPFDDIMPWKGMVKVEDSTVGTLVEIPKFWYKITGTGESYGPITFQITNKETEGFSVSPAHMDRGDGKGERDVVYVGRYHCDANNYKSLSGQDSKLNITRATARANIHNLGNTIWQNDFAMRFTIWLLYLVEFADWNSQAKIGYGCRADKSGLSDSMPYHTGTPYSSRDTYGAGVQYRWIESLWDNNYDWIDGCYYNSSGLNLILNPNNFNDSSGGTLVGKPNGSGYVNAILTNSSVFPMFYPGECLGSDTAGTTDSWGYTASNPCISMGGMWYENQYDGLFSVQDWASSSTGTEASVSCRLMKLP